MDPLDGAKGSKLLPIKRATVEDLEATVKKMQSAKAYWQGVPAPLRGEIVRQIGDELRKHKKDLATIISLEMGKIEGEALGEVQEAVGFSHCSMTK